MAYNAGVLTNAVKPIRSGSGLLNKKFFELPEEKQLRIINAGLEVFAQSEYKKASTEDIAVKAGISKGLLFYYFHDKKTLYLFLYDYSEKLMTQSVMDDHFSEITDVFELLEYAAGRKYAVLEKSPHVMDFITRAFYSEKEAVSGDLNKRLEKTTAEIYGSCFTKMDSSKFKPEVDAFEILQMLTWTADGYLHEKQRLGKHIDLDDLMEKYKVWSALYKKIAYKEEY
jgi:TetR/AcrR family transcriptional regulator